MSRSGSTNRLLNTMPQVRAHVFDLRHGRDETFSYRLVVDVGRAVLLLLAAGAQTALDARESREDQVDLARDVVELGAQRVLAGAWARTRSGPWRDARLVGERPTRGLAAGEVLESGSASHLRPRPRRCRPSS